MQPVPRHKRAWTIGLSLTAAFLLLTGLAVYGLFKVATRVDPQDALRADMEKITQPLFTGYRSTPSTDTGPVPITGREGTITVHDMPVTLNERNRLTVTGTRSRFCLQLAAPNTDAHPLYYDSVFQAIQYGTWRRGACGVPGTTGPDPSPRYEPAQGILTRDAPIVRAAARDDVIDRIEKIRPDLTVQFFGGFEGGLDTGSNGLSIWLGCTCTSADAEQILLQAGQTVWETYQGPVDDSLEVTLYNGSDLADEATSELGRLTFSGGIWQGPADWGRATPQASPSMTPATPRVEVYEPVPAASEGLPESIAPSPR